MTAEENLRLPHELRAAIRRQICRDKCINCDLPMSEDIHSVVVACSCGQYTPVCKRCFGAILNRAFGPLEAV